jgi:hypothetical protein
MATDKDLTWVFYCQSDGGQWNIPVYRMKLNTEFGNGNSVISGSELVGTAKDKDGYDMLVVSDETLFDEPQATYETFFRKDKA